MPGLHDEWVIILSFDSDANLTAWLNSPARQALLAEGARFQSGLSMKQANYGFNFWFAAGRGVFSTRCVPAPSSRNVQGCIG
jgi:antibiotic biosynthesis monooxygenase (ABM) superfamily enzyme